MSEHSQQDNFAQRVSGRWQMPLLLFSVTMLVLGIWRLKPAPVPPSFEQLYDRAVALREAGLYPEASDYIGTLMTDPVRTPTEMAQLHRLMADVIFMHESANVVHGSNNVRRILEHTDKAAAGGAAPDARTYRMRGLAMEWLQRAADAVKEYQAALDAGSDRPWELRRRVLEIQRTLGALSAEQLHKHYDAFLEAPGISDEMRYWAAEQKVDLCEQEGQHREAEQFLAAHAARFVEPAWRRAYDYLQALAWFHVQRLDDAERLLRSIRDEVPPGHSLYARAGWLLGRILQANESPEVALGYFDEVIDNTVPGPYRTASILGRAEALASLERYEDSVAAYRETIRLTTENPYGSVVDLRVVRESTMGLYQAQLAAGRLREALAYLRLGLRLVPPADAEAQAESSERLASLTFALGKSLATEAEDARAADPERAREALTLLTESAEEYLKLSRGRTISRTASEAAVWQAADAFDLAGMPAQAVEVLETFVREHSDSTRAPMALLRIGQAYQAMGRIPDAIAKFQQNLIDFPRTPSAVASLVPLADCFAASGSPQKAEEVLLRIVVRQPNDPLTLITPAALEYRDALFRLGDLYMRGGEFEKAIGRYEEAVERYRDDPRSGRAVFQLAEACRQSAARIRTDLGDPTLAPFKDDLAGKHRQRLKRARQLYDEVIARYSAQPAESLSELEQTFVKLSHFYRADNVYDLSRVGDPGDMAPFAEAIELYERAAWLYQSDPIAMTAYVQMVNCHLQMGQADKAWMTLQRARWILKGIPDEHFRRFAPAEDRTFWETYLTWLEKAPTFALAAG